MSEDKEPRLTEEDKALMKEAGARTGGWLIDKIFGHIRGLIITVVILLALAGILKATGNLPEDSSTEEPSGELFHPLDGDGSQSAGGDTTPEDEFTGDGALPEAGDFGEGMTTEESIQQVRDSATCEIEDDPAVTDRTLVIAETVDGGPATIWLEVEFADGAFEQFVQEYPSDGYAQEDLSGEVDLDALGHGAAGTCQILNVIPH